MLLYFAKNCFKPCFFIIIYFAASRFTFAANQEQLGIPSTSIPDDTIVQQIAKWKADLIEALSLDDQKLAQFNFEQLNSYYLHTNYFVFSKYEHLFLSLAFAKNLNDSSLKGANYLKYLIQNKYLLHSELSSETAAYLTAHYKSCVMALVATSKADSVVQFRQLVLMAHLYYLGTNAPFTKAEFEAKAKAFIKQYPSNSYAPMIENYWLNHERKAFLSYGSTFSIDFKNKSGIMNQLLFHPIHETVALQCYHKSIGIELAASLALLTKVKQSFTCHFPVNPLYNAYNSAFQLNSCYQVPINKKIIIAPQIGLIKSGYTFYNTKQWKERVSMHSNWALQYGLTIVLNKQSTAEINYNYSGNYVQLVVVPAMQYYINGTTVKSTVISLNFGWAVKLTNEKSKAQMQ